ncbi:MAG: GNAT family N-acetyltransferase [Betaproteobacteria bacterium]|nr:GNAT family N-acetyltransferase [Betaproteobacteria bacterium]
MNASEPPRLPPAGNADKPVYPAALARNRRLFDGTPVAIRPIRPEDSGMEQEFVRHLSEDSRYFRFLGSMRELPPKKLKYFTEIDYDLHMAFVAVVLREGKEVEIGVARYVGGAQRDKGEFAVAVDDDWQGTGVAGLLMASLMDAARERGFRTMEGLVLRSNLKMLKFAKQLGFKLRPSEDDAGTVVVARPL